MKNLLIKLCLSNILLVFWVNVHSQNNSAHSPVIDSLKTVLLKEKDDTNKVNTLDHICDYFWDIGDYENTMLNANAVFALSTKINYKPGIADGYLNIGLAYNIKKDRFNESEYFNKALVLYKAIGDKQNLANCYDWMESAYEADEDFPKEIQCAYAGQEIKEQVGDKKSIANGFLLITDIFFKNSDDVKEQLKNILSALKLYKEINNKKGIRSCYFMLGRVYNRQGKFTEALNKYNDALQVLKDNDTVNHSYTTVIFSSMAYAYAKQGDSAYEKGDKTLAANKYLEAEKNQIIALNKWKVISDKTTVAFCYAELGNLNIKLNKLSNAKRFYDSSLAIFKLVGDKQGLTNVYYGFSKIDSGKGNFNNAYKNYKLFKTYYDSTYSNEDAKKLVQVQMQYDFDKKIAIAKLAQDNKDAEEKRVKKQQYFAIACLAMIMLAIAVIAVIQFRNSKHKQKANVLLLHQKEEIEKQKQKVETTLSELKSTQSQLIQSEKMASLGELTAGIAHEIQNPLNFVNNFSEVNRELVDELQSELRSGNTEEAIAISNDIKDNEEKINHHGKRADAIVKGMLQHSRSSTGVKELTDINALADEYLRLSYHGLRAKDKDFNATMKTDFDEAIGKINIIPQDIGRVLLNLYNNAFYAVNEKRKSANTNYDPEVEVETSKDKNGISISVCDNGNGIPQKIIDKIFQPFFTTKPTGRGTGLGLSLSYDIIKAHGGEIKVETKEGEGTDFIIQLQQSLKQ
jgi:signal transduction histidine kinase/tetratricopeptide (TPR) repeat protein